MKHYLPLLVVAVAAVFAGESSAIAQGNIVDVIPLTDNCDWAVAPDGSGLVLSSTDGATAKYLVGISSDAGFTTSFVSVSDSVSLIDQEGDSGLSLAPPLVIQQGDAIAFCIGVTSNATGASAFSSSSSRSWLDSYADWFNSTFGSGWSEVGGGVIHDGLTLVLEEETLANTSDGALLTGTIIVSVPAGVAIFYGGEVALGVGTFGGEAAGGLTAAQIEINAAYQEILIAEQQIAALEATQAQLIAGPATAIEVGGYEAYAAARLASIENAIVTLESQIQLNWTWIDLLLPGL